MRWIRGIRSMAPWVLAIFVFAQLSGLVPGHYEHAGAMHGHAVLHAPNLGAGSPHHHVLGNASDECCAVHAMPIVPALTEAVSPGLGATHRLFSAQQTLVPIRFAPLDPPPKLSASV